ncbi:MAG TPA: hypothetical protein VGX23_26240 [Actinocrinis sp.]|nr:hypothetical protein [Actinocrinis sp.]
MDHPGWERVRTDAAERPESHESWIRGLAQNSAASAAVLRRVITVQDRLAYPDIWLTMIDVSAQTFAELAAHPDAGIRRRIAQNEHADIGTLTLLAADPEPRVRLVAVVMANDRGLTFGAPLVARFQADEDSQRIRSEARTQASRSTHGTSTIGFATRRCETRNCRSTRSSAWPRILAPATRRSATPGSRPATYRPHSWTAHTRAPRRRIRRCRAP